MSARALLMLLLFSSISFGQAQREVRVELDRLFAELPEALELNGVKYARPITARLTIDDEREVEVAPDEKARLLFPVSEQHDITASFYDAKGKLLHRTDPCLLEATDVQTLAGGTFASQPFDIVLPEALAGAIGIDPRLTGTAVKLGREKLVWIAREPILPRTEVRADFDPHGEVTAIDLRTADGEERRTGPEALYVKVDAAFNGNAFFWDDMFVSLETTWHQPALARHTLDFWYDTQRRSGTGVIPREVRKRNRVSYNPPQKTKTGKSMANGGYTNPYLAGWVEEQLYALSDPTVAKARLANAVASIDHYIDWQKKNRLVENDYEELPPVYWHDNLGSGMDNSPRGGRDITKTVWVDLLAQEIAMRKQQGRFEATLGHFRAAMGRERQAKALERYLNSAHWSEEKAYYFDRVPDEDGELVLDTRTPTIAGFWPLWAGAASKSRVDKLVEKQLVAGKFGGPSPFPSLSPEHPLYSDDGHYWRGGRWPSTTTMAIEGLERSGRPDVAAEMAGRVLARMSEVAQDYAKEFGRLTVAESYGIQRLAGGAVRGIIAKEPGHKMRVDFAGWGAVPPIHSNLRHLVGLRAVPGFAGDAAHLDDWLDNLAHSPLWKNLSFADRNPFWSEPGERAKIGAGYLEWNLLVDPGADGFEIRNFFYRGIAIESLGVRRLEDGKLETRAKSEHPFPLQINRLFDGKRTSPAPLSIGRIEDAGGSRSVYFVDDLG